MKIPVPYIFRFIWSLAKRDIAMRFRGSLLGALWLVLNPLFSLTLYYYVFSIIFKVRWAVLQPDGRLVDRPGALALFAGLMAYMFFSECLTRAPGLIRENSSYVKKIVFPLATLPVAAVISALFSAGVNFGLFLIFYVFSVGAPSWHILFFPVIFFAFALGCLGLVYGLSALGMYIPDLKNLMPPISMLFMFITPIMYPLSLVPENLQSVVLCNPLTLVVENLRLVLFEQTVPPLGQMTVLMAAALVVFALGFYSFKKLRKGFADVI